MILSIKLALIFIWSIPLVAFSQQTVSGSQAYPSELGSIAASYFKKGELILKNQNVRKAYPFFKKSFNQAAIDHDWNLYVKVLNKLAFSYDSLEDNQRNEVFTWLKQAFNVVKDDSKNEGLSQLHFNVAEFYNNLTYDVDTTLYHYQAALRGWTSLNGESNALTAACYHGMGDVYKFYKNDFFEAEQCYEKALLIREKIKFNDERVLARNYYGLATTNRSQRDFEKALDYGIKTLELSKKLNNLVYQEMTSNIVANIYRDMGKSAMAKEYYFKAIALNQKRSSPEDLASYYAGLGEISKNDSLFNDAINYFQKSFSIYTKTNDKLRFTYLLNQMGETYLMKKDFPKSIEMFRKLLNELSLMHMLNGRQAYHAYVGLGDYYFILEQNDSAIFYYQKAMASVVRTFSSMKDNPKEEMITSNYYIHGVLDKKARVLNALYFHTKDYSYLKRSLDCLILAEKLLSKERNTLDMEDSKWDFLAANYNVYEEIIASAFEASTINSQDSLIHFVFRYFEKSKARSLTDALIQAEQTNKIRKDDNLLRMQQELKRKIFQIQDNLNKELEKNPAFEGSILLRQEIVNLDRKLQQIKESIEKKYPGYFGIKYGNFIPSLQSLQESLKSKNQVILEYFWGSESVYALGISSNKVLFKNLGSVDSIRAITNALMLHFVDEHSSTSLKLYNSFVTNSCLVYKILVEPFQPILSKNVRLQIIPDGLIGQIPFEILLKEANPESQVNYLSLPYLIKENSIGYAYSSAILIRNTSVATRKPSLLAMGFTNSKQLQNSDSQFQELAGSELELKTLATHFNSGKFLEGSEATESNFKILSPDFDILHLAIHGKGETDKKFSASLYFRAKADSIEDGELHAYELYGIKLKATLAVLTSCESGLGKDYKGEGMMSMASGFTYAGCENVLMSLWKVNDQASITLMDNFYSHLIEGRNIDDALSRTKLKYLERADELTADPRIWASLVVYGKLNQVFVKEEGSRIYIIVTLSISTLLLLAFLLKRNGLLSW